MALSDIDPRDTGAVDQDSRHLVRRFVTRAALSGAVAFAGAMAGCGLATDNGAPVSSISGRVSLEAVSAELTEAEGRIRDVVSEILPDGQWTQTREPWTSPCRENRGADDPRAKAWLHGNWQYRAIPTTEQWIQIRESVLPIVADYGFTEIAMDTPAGDGAVFKVAGVYEGSRFSIQYNKAIAMSFRSGCHVPEAAAG